VLIIQQIMGGGIFIWHHLWWCQTRTKEHIVKGLLAIRCTGRKVWSLLLAEQRTTRQTKTKSNWIMEETIYNIYNITEKNYKAYDAMNQNICLEWLRNISQGSKCQSQSLCPHFLFFPSSYVDNAIQLFVSTIRTNRHSNFTIRPLPTLLLHIPDRQVIPRQSDGHPLSFTCTNFRVREPTENRGGLSRGRWEIYIELWDLGDIVK